MIECKNCGNPLPNDAKFCNDCGQKVERKSFCLNCGREFHEDEKFCANCGRPQVSNQPVQNFSDQYNNMKRSVQKSALANKLKVTSWHIINKMSPVMRQSTSIALIIIASISSTLSQCFNWLSGFECLFSFATAFCLYIVFRNFSNAMEADNIPSTKLVKATGWLITAGYTIQAILSLIALSYGSSLDSDEEIVILIFAIICINCFGAAVLLALIQFIIHLCRKYFGLISATFLLMTITPYVSILALCGCIDSYDYHKEETIIIAIIQGIFVCAMMILSTQNISTSNEEELIY